MEKIDMRMNPHGSLNYLKSGQSNTCEKEEVLNLKQLNYGT